MNAMMKNTLLASKWEELSCRQSVTDADQTEVEVLFS